MIVKIPKQRVNKNNSSTPFKDLVNYGVDDLEQKKNINNKFDNVLNYETSKFNKSYEAKCVAVRTHGVIKIETASQEMDAIAEQNKRCKDPAYHFILSWPEFENPNFEAIFDAAEHAIKSLGMSEHQYVIAVHADTDNLHCHIAINRVHPITFKAKHIEWSRKTLHMAARQSEIKHGWFNDNGYYVVKTSQHGHKVIVLNEKYKDSVDKHGIDPDVDNEITLPSWHDPESLDSWLKSYVTKSLKRDLADLQTWHGLHAWLLNYGIRITESGGGGMRLHVTSAETGEIVEIAASKALRVIKRADLEARWGLFKQPVVTPVILPDMSILSKSQISKGVAHVIQRDPNHLAPPIHLIHNPEYRRGFETQRSGRVHELPNSGMDDGRFDPEVLVQGDVPLHMGNGQTREDQDLRRSGASSGRGAVARQRDTAKREERRKQRAAMRADLRSRFAQYRRFAKNIDTQYWVKLRELKHLRKRDLRDIEISNIEAINRIDKTEPEYIYSVARINLQFSKQKLNADILYNENLARLNETRLPPLGWRVWLHEQANLGDQAAISALRGIVYQAKRDAKRDQDLQVIEDNLDAKITDANERRFKKLMQRLMEEEQQEIAIRAAKFDLMRPHEIDALIYKYQGLSWYVTGNGNIEYSRENGDFLFTDRGNRITFDRETVTDDEIRIALFHSSHKFGNQIVLTGQDDIFTKRMARIAAELNLRVINPELQEILEVVKAERIDDHIKETVEITVPEIKAESLGEFKNTLQAKHALLNEVSDPVDLLKMKVLAIEPRAKFETVDNEHNFEFEGNILVKLDDNTGFAQHKGRGIYLLHMIPGPDNTDKPVKVIYRNGQGFVEGGGASITQEKE